MDIAVDPAGVPTMHGADDFTSLRLTGTRPSSSEALATLAGWGIELTPDGDHGHIAPGSFARLAGPSADRPDWQQGLDGMLTYATSKGWIDESGRVRAHADWGG